MTKRVLLVSLLTILALVFVCVWLTSQLDWEYIVETLDGGTHIVTASYESLNYAFDPRVVATAVPAGDFLTPVPPGTPRPTSEPIPGLAVLDEGVFYAVASRLVEKEDGLRLISVGFGSPCAYAGLGLDGMDFDYIKRRDKITDWKSFPYLYVSAWVFRIDRVSYETHVMDAAASYTKQPTLDYEGLEIKALEAIRIAEDHGGRDFRGGVDNACIIHGGLSKGGATWNVRYRREGEESAALDFEIDAITGEVIAVER